MSRMKLLAPRPKKDGGTYWLKIGTAFPRDNGGFSLVFDALPLPDDKGAVRLLMAPEDDGPRQRGGAPAGGQRDPLDGDGIPFAPW